MTQSSQTHSFFYDSRSRLTSATNPENATVSYSYDDNGNLTQRASGASGSVTVNYSYDPLNRIYVASYIGVSTLAVTYCYDGKVFGGGDGVCTAGSVANSVGQLT